MRILMMGTGAFAVPTFEWLVASSHALVGLVTRPTPAHSGRRKTPVNPMREVAERNQLEILEPPDVNAAEATDQLRRRAPDLLVVCDYGQILSPTTLSVAPLGGINLHGSLLPKYRGAAPVNWAIWEGESETGVTVIHMTPRLDAGPTLIQRRTPIDPDEDASVLEARLAQLGTEPVRQAIRMLNGWDRHRAIGTPQDPAQATRAPRLKKSDGEVVWSQPALRIGNQVPALKPWPGTYTHLARPGKERLRLILDRVAVLDHASPPGARPGEVIHANGERLLLATGGGVLSVLRIQPAGKRVMEIGEFLRGHPLQSGTVLAGRH